MQSGAELGLPGKGLFPFFDLSSPESANFVDPSGLPMSFSALALIPPDLVRILEGGPESISSFIPECIAKRLRPWPSLIPPGAVAFDWIFELVP